MSGYETINGMEFTWVQPLDFALEQYGLKGFGWQANATFIRTHSSIASIPAVMNVSPFTYNVTGYYDNDGIMVKLSYAFTQGTVTNSSAYGTISSLGNLTGVYSMDYAQADLSSGVKLSKFLGDVPTDPEITFDVQNLFHAKVGRGYMQYKNMLTYWYNPGSVFMLGLRGSF
jgi:hypothetical protein